MAKKSTASTVPKQLTPWQPGQSGNPAGRKPGSRNKLSEDFIAKLYEDFQVGGVEAIRKCREDEPSTYVKVIAGLLPKEMHIKDSPLEDMSDDDIRDALVRIAALRAALLGSDASEAGGSSQGQARPH